MPTITRTTAKSRPAQVVPKPTTSRLKHPPQKRPVGKAAGAPKAKAQPASAVVVSASPPGAAKSARTKKALIAALLQRPDGVVMAELMSATGWQEHSIRAALTGLRRDGQEIVRSRDAVGATCYRVAKGA